MQTVYRVYEGAREPHRLAVEHTAELLGRGGLALIPTETVYGVAVAVNAFSDAVPKIQANSHRGRAIRRPPSTAPRSPHSVPAIVVSLPSSSASSRKRLPGWLMMPRHSIAMAWISLMRPACSPDDAGRVP